MTDKTLIPVEQRQVVFYEDEITAVLVEVEEQKQVYIPISPICDLLGLSFSGQSERIKRDAVLSEVSVSLRVTRRESQRGEREMLCLPLDFLNGWLFSVNASRVKAEIRERLMRYQRECYRVLAEAFQEGRLTADPAFDELLQQDTPEVQAYKMLQGMVKLARNQILMRTQLEDHKQRLESIESQLGDPDRLITPAQASEISQAVKAIAMALSKKSGRNEYGGVYGELYRRYEIPGYKELPANKFDSCIKWLNEWLQSLIQDIPF